MKKPTPTRRPRSDAGFSAADPYKPARRPVRVDRAERSERSERPARADRPARAERSERPARPARFSDTRAPRAARPPRDGDDAPRYGARRFGGGESGSGFTVNLDPDVARVFRGDASVNKALRLVLQLMQVVQGPAPRFGSDRPRSPGGYRGSAEARGFERKPRFEDEEE